MSNTSLTETKFNFDASVQSFLEEPIIDSVQKVMENLVPLVSTESSLDKEVTDELRLILGRFAKFVNTIYMVVVHTGDGLFRTCGMLALAHARPSLIVIDLQSIAESFMLGCANALEAQEMCGPLKEDVEKKFRLLEESYGANAVVQVSRKGRIERLTIQSLGGIINWHIGQLYRSCTLMTTLIQGTNNLLREFLDDDQISLERPLTEAPLWSESLFSTWKDMTGTFNRLSTHIKGPMHNYPGWFMPITGMRELEIIRDDVETRRRTLVQPVIKIKVPKDPGPTKSLPKGTIKSGEFVTSLESIERTGHGIVSVKLRLTASHSNEWFNHLKKFYIVCQVPNQDKPSLIRFSNIKPASLKDLKDDPEFQPKGCKPNITVDTSTASMVKWTFSRPLYQRNASLAIPSQVTVSFDVAMTQTTARVEFNVGFMYRQSFMPPVTFTDSISASRPLELPPGDWEGGRQPVPVRNDIGS